MTFRQFINQKVRRLTNPLSKGILAAVVVLLFGCAAALAQSGAGSIQGTVKDASGAALPNASVQVINKATGQVSNAKTNSVGFYSVPGLFAGDYTVAVTAPGLAEYDTTLSLQVSQTAVISPTLSVGTVSQEVTVNSGIQLATYDSGTISSNLDNARINQLPMNGRNILTLTGQTTPGLEANGTRANGNMAAALEYVQDGAPLADRNFGGATIQPDPDAVQEVKIETTNSNAKFTTPATAIVTTKSGTNSLHGSLFETARNNAIGVAKSRTDPYNLKAPHLVRNEFGASVGGPIVFPRIYNGKNKSFFFFAYERYSLRQTSSERTSVPTDAMRGGDFSNLLSAATPVTLYNNNTTNPVTYQRQPYANNVITAPISPFAKAIYSVTPHATTQDNPYEQSNYIGPALNQTTTPTVTFRLDHSYNDNNRAYLRYTQARSQALSLRNLSGVILPDTITASGIPAGTLNRSSNLTKVYSAAIGFTHIFSPTFVSETVLSNEWESATNLAAGNPLLNYESKLGLPNNFGQIGFPQLTGTGMLNYSGTQYNYQSSQIITNIDENFTKTLNRHQLFFGGRYRHERIGALPDRTGDSIDFNSGATAVYNTASGANYAGLPHTGDSNADFYLGAAHSYAQQLNAPYQHWRDQEFDAYIQDDFHVTDKLTLNLGLRWEAHPAATVKDNLFSSFDFKNKAIVLGGPVQKFIDKGYTTQTIVTNLINLGTSFETPSQAGLPENMINSSNAIFAPRVGFAYAPFGSGKGMVFRAGYGRYVYPIPVRNFYASSKLNAPYASRYTQDFNSASQSPDGLPNYFIRANGTPVVAGVNSSGVVNSGNVNSLKPGDPREFVLNPHYPPNIVTQFNATIEQPLPGSSVLRVSYLWDHGENLDQENHLNNPMSTYVWETKTGTIPPKGTYANTALNAFDQTTFNGGFTRQDRNGWSNDNALQLNYQRLYKHGYAYQVFYVYSRAMRVGGNAFRDGVIYPLADYAPGMAPTTDEHELNVFQNYGIDTAIPEHRINFNGIVDLPIGRGKRFFGNANRFVNELIGGYQIAGSGSIVSQYFGLDTSNWGPTNPLKVYNKKYKIQDCSSGVCHPGYLWYNGFINPLSINNPCGPALYSGIPTNYTPYQTPINMTTGGTTCVGSAGTTPKAVNPNYLTNIVNVPLANGSMSPVVYSPGPGLNPFSKSVLHGPYNWTADMSLFKVFPITEKVFFRVNVDAFNVFNVQGYNNPNKTTGIQNFLSSHNTPRQLQLTARLTF